ncbi:hypothetical protein C1645_815796 [Glomus cerebriforme]|uniref:Uncharacterized protein n=1 Tax=Glomus cerebriforme TaxID=658196 RepID=A0A397TDV3_9GLOM|nr:hypothetical protein C1645_815796 [Glomus cerebriforme]
MSEKDLYSKLCVAESINFAVEGASDEVIDLTENDTFSCNLATILARDKEVVAVRLKVLPDSCKVYISKNNNWLNEDVEYINKIQGYLRNISKDAPAKSKDVVKALTDDVMNYCSAKLESRFKRLKNDIINGQNDEHIISFLKDTSTDVNNIDEVNKFKLSGICSKYNKKVKNDPTIPSRFLGHLRKVGSYAGSVINIMACARNIKYKILFSNIELYKMDPDIITNQSIFSWKNIIKRFANDEEYELFMKKCLKNNFIKRKLIKIYTDENTKQLQLDNDIKQCIYLHAEMNILTSIIDQDNRNREFIAVSKRCCYLCELYIDFARKQGYNIIISGKHKKIYCGWKLPHTANIDFKNKSLEYILENLDQIIENKIKYYTGGVLADSDSYAGSVDSDNHSEAEEIYEILDEY